jgi:hypothetical protein
MKEHVKPPRPKRSALELLLWIGWSLCRGFTCLFAVMIFFFGIALLAVSTWELYEAILTGSPFEEAVNFMIVGLLQIIMGPVLFWGAWNAELSVRPASGPQKSLPFDEIA